MEGRGEGGQGRKIWGEGEGGEWRRRENKDRLMGFERKNRTPTHVCIYIYACIKLCMVFVF